MDKYDELESRMQQLIESVEDRIGIQKLRYLATAFATSMSEMADLYKVMPGNGEQVAAAIVARCLKLQQDMLLCGTTLDAAKPLASGFVDVVRIAHEDLRRDGCSEENLQGGVDTIIGRIAELLMGFKNKKSPVEARGHDGA